MVKGDRKKGAEDTHMVTYMVMMKNHEYKLVKRGEKTEYCENVVESLCFRSYQRITGVGILNEMCRKYGKW